MNIKLKGIWASREVWLNDKKLSPAKSQKIWNHSPDGFNWGYGGSGPAQLALAICIELFGSKDYSNRYNYQDFKFRYIASLPQSDFDTTIEIPDDFALSEKANDTLNKFREAGENFKPDYIHARFKDSNGSQK